MSALAGGARLRGISSGANVVAALRVAERLGEGTTVVTLAVDSGLRYLSTDVFVTPASSPAGWQASRLRAGGGTPPGQPPGRRRYE
jgi:hypothetical protein